MADSDELGRRLAADVDSSSSNNLFQVMRAVEDAEATIRQQLEENSRLKDELMLKTRELDRIRSEATNRTSFAGVGMGQDRIFEAYGNTFSSAAHGNKTEASKWFNSTSSSPNPQINLASHQNGAVERGEQMLQDAIKLKYLDGNQSNGILRKLSGEQSAAESGVPSQLSTPSSRSLSPARHRKEGEYDSRFNLAGQGLLPVSEMNSNIILKQDLLAKVKEHEEEIAQLRRHLADYSVKEAQILNEKHVLEKRIAYMRMAFDQQQQDLVDAASKALSYRQDIIEENIRLTYALQVLLMDSHLIQMRRVTNFLNHMLIKMIRTMTMINLRQKPKEKLRSQRNLWYMYLYFSFSTTKPGCLILKPHRTTVTAVRDISQFMSLW